MPDSWPSDLPQPFLVDNYGQAIGDGRLISKPDAGPPLVRQRTTSMPDSVQGQFIATKAQIESLKIFVKTTLARGSLPFLLPDPELGSEPLLVMFADDGLPSWDASRRDRYLVTVKLWIMP